MTRSIEMDVHRSFAQIAIHDDGAIVDNFRVDIPPDNLKQIIPAPKDHEQMAGIRVLGQHLLGLRHQRVEAAPRVRRKMATMFRLPN